MSSMLGGQIPRSFWQWVSNSEANFFASAGTIFEGLGLVSNPVRDNPVTPREHMDVSYSTGDFNRVRSTSNRLSK
jgi:hypothetical protein